MSAENNLPSTVPSLPDHRHSHSLTSNTIASADLPSGLLSTLDSSSIVTETTLAPLSSAGTFRTSYSTSRPESFIQRPFNNLAAMRFIEFIEDYRPIPPNYTALPVNYRWIPPPPLTREEESRPLNHPAIFISPSHIRYSYYPPQYYGVRRTFNVDACVVSGLTIRRGDLVVFEDVVGLDVNYRVNRVRAYREDIADVEVVGFTADGRSHPETSLYWPPIILELPRANILMSFQGVESRGSEEAGITQVGNRVVTRNLVLRALNSVCGCLF